jgi:hypothetical protein
MWRHRLFALPENRQIVLRSEGRAMIIAQVRFELREAVSLEQITKKFESTAPKYKGRDGLIRKCYVRSEDGLTVGAFYFWESRQRAENTYTDEWKEMVRTTYGAEPLITFFDSPVIVDNTTSA